jgi:RND superfamily putative drug exporter
MLAALGRLAHRRRRLIITLWSAVLVLGFTVGISVFNHLSDSGGVTASESARGLELLKSGQRHSAGVVAVVSGVSADAPRTRNAVQAVTAKLEALPYVHEVHNAYNSPDADLTSSDGRTSIVAVVTERTTEMMAVQMRVDELRSLLHGSVPGGTVRVGGDYSVMRDEMSTSQTDLVRGEAIALPILMLALLFVFRGWRAALLPLAGSLVTVAGALLLLLAATSFIGVASYAIDVIALFGLALAVDYSLLVVSRFREERADGTDVPIAVERTVATAGRTLVFSAMTVIAALAGLFAFGEATFTSLALGGIATVLVAVAAGLTLVPALTATWGQRIAASSHNGTGASVSQEADQQDGFFGRLARTDGRRPVPVAVAVTAVLLAAAAPFLGVTFSNGDYRVLPTSEESRQATDTLMDAFPALGAAPVTVVAHASQDDPRVTTYADQLRQLPHVTDVKVGADLPGGYTALDVMPDGQPQGAHAQQLVRMLRGDRPAFDIYVTGQAAALLDFQHRITERLPYALALIAASTFVLLFLMTGSVLVPVKALAMNTLSLGATFGAMVWVFQDGHLSGLLGFTSFGAIEVWVPVLVFVFGFGLSMDYEVFLLSRIKEEHDRTGDTSAAVADGLQRSGRIITSAAVLVLIVFLGFVAGENVGIKEMGLALAIAVAVDATLVRCLLVPATMTLMGRANWWAPTPLRRLHDRFGLREASLPPQPAAPEPADSAMASASAYQ